MNCNNFKYFYDLFMSEYGSMDEPKSYIAYLKAEGVFFAKHGRRRYKNYRVFLSSKWRFFKNRKRYI